MTFSRFMTCVCLGGGIGSFAAISDSEFGFYIGPFLLTMMWIAAAIFNLGDNNETD